MSPFARPIQEAAQRFGEQSANIAQTATSNINQIMRGVAQLRSQGIMEGSQAWGRALQQLGVTAQNYPMVKQAMEDRKYEISQRPANERYRDAQIGGLEAQATDRKAAASKRIAEAEGYAAYLGWLNKGSPVNEIPPEARPYVLADQKQTAETMHALAVADEDIRKAETAKWDKIHKATGAYLGDVEGLENAGPGDVNTQTAIRGAYTQMRNRLEPLMTAEEFSPLPPEPDAGSGALVKGLNNRAGIFAGVKPEKPPTLTPENLQKEFQNAAGLIVSRKDTVGKLRELDFQLKRKALSADTKEQLGNLREDLQTPEGVARVKGLAERAVTSAFGLWQQENPTGTLAQWNDLQAQQAKAMRVPEGKKLAGSAEERYLQRSAERMGKTVDTLTQEEENALLGEYKAAQKNGATPDLPDTISEIPGEETLWNSLGWFTTGPLSVIPKTLGTLTGTMQGPVANRQKFDSAKNTMLRALAENPRFPVAEATRIEKEIQINPNWWDSVTTLRTRMREVDRYLDGVVRRREASKDEAGAMAIQQFRSWMGVPSKTEEGKPQGGGAAPLRPKGVPADARWDAATQNWVK